MTLVALMTFLEIPKYSTPEENALRRISEAAKTAKPNRTDISTAKFLEPVRSALPSHKSDFNFLPLPSDFGLYGQGKTRSNIHLGTLLSRAVKFPCLDRKDDTNFTILAFS